MSETATTTATRVRIGKGDKVHVGTTEGMTRCSAGRRMGRRSGTSVLPADTAVTCTKCDPNATATPAVEVAAPAAGFCANVVYGETCGARLMRDGTCGMCAE